MNRVLLAILTIGSLTLSGASVSGYEPPWSPVIIATGKYRETLQATPIQYRPNRPFHFYGNAVRRRYHTGSYLPIRSMQVQSSASR